MKLKFVRLIVDGSAVGNPGSGGWACILQHQTNERVLTGWEPQSTNNKMEMVAALRGLQALKEPCEVEVITDSENLQRGMTQFLAKWKVNNWRGGMGQRTDSGAGGAIGAVTAGHEWPAAPAP